MDTLRDWTSYGEEGKADSKSLRYFSGTATYRTTVNLENSNTQTLKNSNTLQSGACKLSLGSLPTGVAHVFVNGKDCGTVWCAPWEADISSAVRPGENEIEIRYTNNWYNRLVGDCFLGQDERVTRSTLRYWNLPRVKNDSKRPWRPKPTLCSGPDSSDPLQSSGLLGPVTIR